MPDIPTDDALAWAVTAHKNAEQAARYRLYRDYAEGRQGTRFTVTTAMAQGTSKYSDWNYNRCAGVVDAYADRMGVAGFGSKDDAAAQRATELWDANRMDSRQDELWQEVFTAGDGYVFVEKHPESGAVHIWTEEADNIRVMYSTEMPGKVTLASKAWVPPVGRPGAGYLRLNLYHEDRIEKYVTAQKSHTGVVFSPKAFVRWEEDGEVWPMPLQPDDTVPVFHLGNKARTGRYGVSELRDVLNVQDAINDTWVNEIIAEIYVAISQRVIIGVDTSTEENNGTSDAIARFRTGADRILTLADPAAKIAEFKEANLQALANIATEKELQIARISKVPVHYLTQTGGFPSGRAMRTAEAPFVSKIEDRQKAFGQILTDVMAYALRLDGMATPAQIITNWIPAAPLAKEDAWDIAAIQKLAGMPLPAILREMGYEPDAIKKIAEEIDRIVEANQRRFDAGNPPIGDEDEEEGA